MRVLRVSRLREANRWPRLSLCTNFQEVHGTVHDTQEREDSTMHIPLSISVANEVVNAFQDWSKAVTDCASEGRAAPLGR